MIGKVPQTYAKTTLHDYEVDGWVVRTTLSPHDLAELGGDGALAALRRVRAYGGVVRRAEREATA